MLRALPSIPRPLGTRYLLAKTLWFKLQLLYVCIRSLRPNQLISVLQDFLSSSKEVSVAIGINPCSPSSCLPPSEILGRPLYSGPYHPRYDSDKPFLQPYQNFSVTIPTTIPKGRANIGVAHFTLVGVHLVQLYIDIRLTLYCV